MLTCRPRHAPALVLLARQHGLPVEELGTVGGDRLVIELTGHGATGAAEERGSRIADAVDVPVADLRHAWEHGLLRALGEDGRPARFRRIAEMCGVFGVVLPTAAGSEAAQIAALGLFALQHRGQESAGLAVSDGRAADALQGPRA